MTHMTPTQKQKLDELTLRYKYSFYIQGALTTSYNILRLASFVSLKNPTEYESFQVDADRTLIFYNIPTRKIDNIEPSQIS